jgi:hypothetical protein
MRSAAVEVAGINLNLGEKQGEDLMRQAATKKKPEMRWESAQIRLT